MKYTNPIVKGFYPDPSVCKVNDTYYLVTSSFQYFPGVPLLRSKDLVNWEHFSHVLTRPSQVMLDNINSSGGVFAPTIRYNEGRFYMVTTNDTTHKHFYVYTDDIEGEWSEPITVDQNGIDPSLYFEDGRTYFISNGSDDEGIPGVVQCEIDITTGRKLTKSKTIWQGSGGRYLESPHMYKINGMYYLMAAEGGTEYGHMITYARSSSIWGPFENYPNNPVLTNRNKAPYIIQGIGHGDLIEGPDGCWYILSLGFRQIHIWQPYHHLGREVFLTPVSFNADGWFTAGVNGTTDDSYEIAGDFEQASIREYNMNGDGWSLEWCYLRHPVFDNYEIAPGILKLHGTDVTLDTVGTPSFLGVRQRDFNMLAVVTVSTDVGEAGITVYMNEAEHYEAAIQHRDGEFYAILRLNIGGIHHIQNEFRLDSGQSRLSIKSDSQNYYFYANDVYLGSGQTKYLSSEVSGGFTGVLVGLYATGDNNAFFNDLSIKYISKEN